MSKHVPAEFKPSALGTIPIRWEVRKLHEIATINDGAHQTPTYTEKGKPFLRVTDIQSQNIDFASIKYIPENEHYELTKRCKPEKGDILLSKNGTIGIVKVVTWNWDFSIFVSLALIKIIKKDCIHLWYLSKVLESPSIRLQIKERAKQGTVTNLHLEEIREFDILVPPLPEQRKIAVVLSSADRSIAATEKLIAKLADLKKALMQQLLTKGIGHTEFKPSPLGQIPKIWGCVTLSQHAKLKGGYAFSSEDYADDGIQLIRMGNLYQNQLDLSREPKYLPSYFRTRYSDFLLSPGDIVISMTGTLGKRDYGYAIQIPQINKSFLLNQRVGKFFVDDNINIDYLLFLLHSDSYLDELYTKAGGTKQANLTNQQILEINVPLPPLPEQRMIADILSTVDRKLSAAKVKLAKAKDLKQGLMNDLLTGKVRVSA